MEHKVRVYILDEKDQYAPQLKNEIESNQVELWRANQIEVLAHELGKKAGAVIILVTTQSAEGRNWIRRLDRITGAQKIPLLVISEDANALMSNRIGTIDWLVTPFPEKLLLQKVGNLVERSFYMQTIAMANAENVKASNAIREMEKKVESCNQMKNSFLANISHEIRTPLNVIMGMTELLSYTDLDEEQMDHLEKIYGAGGELVHLITDIMDLSKAEAKELEIRKAPFSLTDLFQDLFNQFTEKAQANGINLSVPTLESKDLRYIGDRDRIFQVLAELIDNAIKFTENGCVALQFESNESDDTVDFLYFQCVDSGIGIRTDEVEHIFDKFSQIDGSSTRKYRGKGLGLTLSKTLAELMGGCLAVESNIGEGSTFTLALSLEKSD